MEEAFQRGIAKVRKGEFHAYPQNRTRTVLSDPYEGYFGDAANDPFRKITARQLKEKYSYNKRNSAKWEAQKMPHYPQHLPKHRSTKNHKNLYQRLEHKQRRANGKKILRDWDLTEETE